MLSNEPPNKEISRCKEQRSSCSILYVYYPVIRVASRVAYRVNYVDIFSICPASVWLFTLSKVYHTQKVFWWRIDLASQKQTLDRKRYIVFSDGAFIMKHKPEWHNFLNIEKWLIQSSSHFFQILAPFNFHNYVSRLFSQRWENSDFQLLDCLTLEQSKFEKCDIVPALILWAIKMPYFEQVSNSNTYTIS